MTPINMATRAGLVALAALALSALALSGCALVKGDPAAEATATRAYEHLARGEDDALEAMMVQEQRGPQLHEAFAKIRTLVPPGPIPKPETINTSENVGTGGVTLVLVHQYVYPQQTVTTTATLVPAPEPRRWWIRGFYVNTTLTSAPAPAPHPTSVPAASHP